MDAVVSGAKASKGIVRGKAVVLNSPKDVSRLSEGDILVTTMTNPDFVPVMRKAAAIVTVIGGRLCHAAIVARELGIPAVVKVDSALSLDGKDITVNGDEGTVIVHG